jgi:RimJ/RimL family protein N-acetyltransferase
MGTMPTAATPEMARPRPEPDERALPAEAARFAGPLTLRNGSVVYMRAIRPDDTERLQAFHRRLSPDSVVYRYFQSVPILSNERAEHLTHVDYEQRMALVATMSADADAPIIAVVRYERIDATTAEAAFLVEDRWQGQGIASQLFKSLTAYARRRGITTIIAETMTSNVRMLKVLRHAGFPYTMHYDNGCAELRLDISAEPGQVAAAPSGGGQAGA